MSLALGKFAASHSSATKKKQKKVSLLKNLESFSVFNSKIQTCRYIMRAHFILKGRCL